jgi:hypothetical protein
MSGTLGKHRNRKPTSASFWRLAALGGAVCGISSGLAGEYNLSLPGQTSYVVPGDFGGNAIVADHFDQPTGTGVFEPFLTIDANGQTSTSTKVIEQGYNTDSDPLYMDQHRPSWNKALRFGDLADLEIGGKLYYGFELDSNEPGQGKRMISVDNIRIYTSSVDNTALVKDDITKLDQLGTLRWAMNDPNRNPDGTFRIDNWIKLDSTQENVEAGKNASNGGSGKSDMIIYVPQSAFVGANWDDYVWFYNLNGVHYDAAATLAAQSGYEEWRAVTGPHVDQHSVPDSGATVGLLSVGVAGLVALRRRNKR